MKYKLSIDGRTYEVDVEATEDEARRDDRPALPSTPARPPSLQSANTAPAPLADGPAVDENKVCRSPIAGVVVRVAAQVGQAIQAHDALMVLEAMKMETTITSPLAGKVVKVNAGVGDPVKGGQVLVEFE